MPHKGRKDQQQIGFIDTVAPGGSVQAILVNQDALIDAMKAMAAKLDADTGVADTDFESSITDSLDKAELK